MSMGGDYLYARLPAVYRTRDALSGEPLRAIMNLLAERAAAVESDIDDHVLLSAHHATLAQLGENVACVDAISF